MRNMLIVGLAVVMATFGTSAFAASFTDNGAALEALLNPLAVDGALVDAVSDAISPDEYWRVTATGGSVNAVMMINITLTQGASGDEFGVYNGGTYLQLFNSGAEVGDATMLVLRQNVNGTWRASANGNTVTFTSDIFGYYVGGADNRFYSDPMRNSNGLDAMAAYQGTGEAIYPPWSPNQSSSSIWTDNEYILAWETGSNTQDRTYTDFAVMVESVQPVPEPTSMALVGMGLIGLLVRRSRRA